jgi:hypothetical protein
MPPPPHRWKFEDLDAGEEMVLDINPFSGGTPPAGRTLTEDPTVLDGAPPIMWEGATISRETSVEGTVLTKVHHYKLDAWAKRKGVIQLTDDLGRVLLIAMVKYDPRRVYSATYPWKHTFTLTYKVIRVVDEGA